MGKRYRKPLNYSINRKMQIRLFMKVLGVSIVGAVLMAVIFYFYSNRLINDSYRQFHVHAQNFIEFLWPAIFLSLITAIFFTTAITLFFPLRIAGPLYRIERDFMDKVHEGDLTVRFKVRKGDEGRELADTINASLDNLRNKIEMIKKPVEELEFAIINQKDNKDKEVERLVKKISKSLQEFKL